MTVIRPVVRLIAPLVLIATVLTALVSAQDTVFFPEPDLNNPAAPFIFTYEYAISKGATAEWRKQEGVVIDAPNKKLYMAITRMTDGMADTEGNIQLAENRCGMVMVGDVDDSWNVTRLTPLIVGGPYDEATESCDVNNISEPDNLYVDANGDLWISEDTDLHVNNTLWKYEVATGSLLRFATFPLGSEGTGLHINQNGDLFLNVQGPEETNQEPFNMATVGVVVGFNTTDSFEALSVPEGDDQTTLKLAAGEYQLLGRTGDPIPGTEEVFGLITTVSGAASITDDGDLCSSPDGNMFLPTNDAGTEAILYTNWECAPGGVTRLDISQGEDGRWTINQGSRVDFASVNGTIYNCNASVTPWNTGLTSEEWAVLDAEEWTEYAGVMDGYVEGTANPYDYGYIVELVPTENGTELIRHYAMGRKDNEQSWVAPDNQTVYFGDDATDKIFYKFIATTPGDLSAGTLYAAKVTQTGSDNTADFAFDLEWIELGTGNNADIEAAVRALETQS